MHRYGTHNERVTQQFRSFSEMFERVLRTGSALGAQGYALLLTATMALWKHPTIQRTS